MSYNGNGGGGSISGSSDVALSNPANKNVLSYNSSTQKWTNANLALGTAATHAETDFATAAEGYDASMLTPEFFGAKGDGTTDDTAALTAWIGSGNIALGLRPGSTYLTTAQLTHPNSLVTVIGNGATIKATASMTNIWAHTANFFVTNLVFSGVNFNCNNLAGGPNFGMLNRGVIRDVKILNSVSDGLTIGAPQPAGSSSGNRLDRIYIDYTGSQQPAASKGIAILNCGDGMAVQCEIIGPETGIFLNEDTGAWRILYAHSWGRAGTLPITCFDDDGHDTQWISCYADSAISYGWRKRSANNMVILGGNYYHTSNYNANDNTVIVVQLDQPNTRLAVTGLIIEGGNSTHRVATDISGDLTKVTASGLTYANVVTMRAAGLIDSSPYDRSSGQESYSRQYGMVEAPIVSGSLQMSFFTATRSDTLSRLRIGSGSVTAAGTTLVRAGLYQIAADGSGTLIASIANDTAIYGLASTGYNRNLTASITLDCGQWYALGILVVASTMPTIIPQNTLDSRFTATAAPPRLAGCLTAQTDLPTSFAGADLIPAPALRPFLELLT